MTSRIMTALSLFTMLVIPFAYGQSGSTSPVLVGRGEIPFKFMVAKKEMPAGKYEVLKMAGQENNLVLRSPRGKASIIVPVIERLAETDPSQKHHARFVFDAIGDQKLLSEFWPADNADGYLLGINKGEEKHAVVEDR